MPPIAPAGLDVRYVDNHLLVVDKPAGLLSQAARPGDDNLVDRAKAWIKARYDKPGNVFVGLVHRLDRNVGGVVVLARTSKAASRLSDAFRRRAVDKRYLAVVAGELGDRGELVDRMTTGPDGSARRSDGQGKRAALSYTRVATAGGVSALCVRLETGRKHQIRAQLAWAGAPLIGDPRYGRRDADLPRPALHAASIAFEHPVRRQPVRFEAPTPADLTALLVRRGLARTAEEAAASFVCSEGDGPIVGAAASAPFTG